MSLELNALFRKYAGVQADLDSAEFRANQAATKAQKSLDANTKDSEKGLADAMASKGMTHSGVNLAENVKIKRLHGENTDKIRADQAASLADIARKRLESTSEFETGKAYDPIKQLIEQQGL